MCCGIAAFGWIRVSSCFRNWLQSSWGIWPCTREPAGRGMAIAGLVLGYVGIAGDRPGAGHPFGLVVGTARNSGYGV